MWIIDLVVRLVFHDTKFESSDDTNSIDVECKDRTRIILMVD